MNECPAVKADGEMCGKRCRGNPRCGVHMKTLEQNGPHTTAQKELGYRHRSIVRQLQDEGDAMIRLEHDNIRKERLRNDITHRIQTVRLGHRHEMELMHREQQDEIRLTGIDPDEIPRRRRDADIRRRQELAQLQWQRRVDFARRAIPVDVNNHIVHQLGGVVNAVERVAPHGELAQFANDNQNVHTLTAVQHTKDMVQKILSIPVPADYRWNMVECSKTPGDIMMCCKLTPKGSWQMVAKYCQDESIYDLGQGIYGKVLDGVWQYVTKSSDKDDLCKILKQEMEDNVGMCAQGNLTRLCNILSGYMEGIGVQESPAEILGRKLPLLMELDDEVERLRIAFQLFVDLSIPEEHWLLWAQPLVESGTLILKSSEDGHAIGLIIT